MPINPLPWPGGEVFVKPDRTLTDPAIKYVTALSTQATVTPRRLGTGVNLEEQSASIGATQIYLTAIPAGLYRVNYYMEVTRAASTSSSLSITFGWTSNTTSKTYAGSAMTGNTTATYQQGAVLVRSDANLPITYATTYASSGATTMAYTLMVTLEQLDA